MALSLKLSGIATNLVMCVAVDDDGTTIKEFVSTDVDSNKTIDAAVTVGSSTWKGTSRKYFSLTANGSFNFHGITFASGHRPTVNDRDSDGVAYFMAFASSTAGGGTPLFVQDSGIGVGRSSNFLSTYSGSFKGLGGTALPTDGSTKFSCGVSHQDSSGDAFYYGLESGSLATDGTSSSSAGFGSTTNAIAGLGGWSGQGNAPGNFHIIALFNRQLTTTEMQSLHNDWFNTLFDQTVAGSAGRLLLLGAG